MPTRMSTRDECCVRAMRASSTRDWRSVGRRETLSRARDHKDLWLVWFDSR